MCYRGSSHRLTKRSRSITKGLSPGLAITAVLVGHLLVCVPAMLNSYVGCVYGINFPVLMRSTFGVYGAYFGVFVRGVVACICKLPAYDQEIVKTNHGWQGFGTQSFQGGQCIQTMVSAIWPSFNKFPNHIPASAHVTSAQMLYFFLFILVQLPLLWLHVSTLRYLFMAKTIIMPIFGLTLFIWALVGGKSPRSPTPRFTTANQIYSQGFWPNLLQRHAYY